MIVVDTLRVAHRMLRIGVRVFVRAARQLRRRTRKAAMIVVRFCRRRIRRARRIVEIIAARLRRRYRVLLKTMRYARRRTAWRLHRVWRVSTAPVIHTSRRARKYAKYYISRWYAAVVFHAIARLRVTLDRFGLAFVLQRDVLFSAGRMLHRRFGFLGTYAPMRPPRSKMTAHPLYGEVYGIHLKEKGRSYEQSFKGPWGKLRYQEALQEGQLKKKLTWELYNRISKEVPLNIPFVYVALHLQPERTTSSLGGVFADQYLVVDMLARCVPAGWKVYVKEHPSQFYPPFCGERSRHADFYADVLMLPNVELVSLSMSTFQLIDYARAVATVTGTVGWEAVIRGTPTLVFGSSWYRYCDGVSYVPTEAALRSALECIQAGARPDFHKVRLFMLALDRVCARTGLGYKTPDEEELGLSHDETVARLSALLHRYWNHMQQIPAPLWRLPRHPVPGALETPTVSEVAHR